MKDAGAGIAPVYIFSEFGGIVICRAGDKANSAANEALGEWFFAGEIDSGEELAQGILIAAPDAEIVMRRPIAPQPARVEIGGFLEMPTVGKVDAGVDGSLGVAIAVGETDGEVIDEYMRKIAVDQDVAI